MTDTHYTDQTPADPLKRGRFSDGHTEFTVHASSITTPDSFQVNANGNRADIVLIVSGLNSGHLHATWGKGWRSFAPDWKMWVEDAAFKVFYNGHSFDNRKDRDTNRANHTDRTDHPSRTDRAVGPGSSGSSGDDGGLGSVRFCNG